MVRRRHELANLLGYDNWADYAAADKMVGSAQNIHDFIQRIAAAADRSRRRRLRLADAVAAVEQRGADSGLCCRRLAVGR